MYFPEPWTLKLVKPRVGLGFRVLGFGFRVLGLIVNPKPSAQEIQALNLCRPL